MDSRSNDNPEKSTGDGYRNLEQRFCDGDADALSGLIDMYVESIYQFALIFYIDRKRACTFTRAVFADACRKRHRYNTDSSLKVWLFQNAVNHARGRIDRRRDSVPPENQVLQLSGNEEKGSVFCGDIKSNVKKLDITHREVLALRVSSGLSINEIAVLSGNQPAECGAILLRGIDVLTGFGRNPAGSRCRFDKAVIGMYALSVLEGANTRAAAAHVMVCDECKSTVLEYRRTMHKIDAAFREHSPEGLVRSIHPKGKRTRLACLLVTIIPVVIVIAAFVFQSGLVLDRKQFTPEFELETGDATNEYSTRDVFFKSVKSGPGLKNSGSASHDTAISALYRSETDEARDNRIVSVNPTDGANGVDRGWTGTKRDEQRTELPDVVGENPVADRTIYKKFGILDTIADLLL